MFESIQRPRRPRPRVLFLLSIAAHAAAVALLLATALWQVDKLEVADLPLLVAGGPGAPMSTGPEEEAEPERKPEKKRPRVRHDLPANARAETAPEESGGGGDGEGQPDGDGQGLGLFPCGEGGSCSSVLDPAPEKAPPPPRKQDEERVVVARLIEGSRIEGNPRIAPPDSVRQAMVRLGQSRVDAAVKMCLDRGGGVRSLRILRSTGHAEYDQRLLAGMRTWRYRPYRLDSGETVPVCTVVTFIYQVQ